MDLMAQIGHSAISVLGLALACAVLYFCAYRGRILSIADPLIIFILCQIFSTALILLLVTDRWMLVQFFFAETAFCIGFRIPKSTIRSISFRASPLEIQSVEMTIAILFVIWFLVSIGTGLISGFPLLANDPSVAKIEMYTGGAGIAKRMNEGVGTLVSVAAIFMAFNGRHKNLFKVITLGAMLLLILSGAKSALLDFIFIFGYLGIKKGMIADAFRKRAKKVMGLIILAGIMVAIGVVFLQSGNLNEALVLLLGRIIFYGDIVIYYYRLDIFRNFNSLGIIAFLRDIANPILGEFRVVGYQAPMGANLQAYTSGFADYSSTTGPNTLFFAGANIYFGLWGGTLYALTMGWIVAKVRDLYLSYNGKSLIKCIIWLTLAIEIFVLPTEAPLFISIIFDTLVPFVIVYGIVRMLQDAIRGTRLVRES
jgi:hypothetical protein